MSQNYKIERFLPLIGLGATAMLVLGVFYGSGQANIVGSAYLLSFTYSDILLQAFEPLKPLVFLVSGMVLICFFAFVLFFIVLWCLQLIDWIWLKTYGNIQVKKRNLDCLNLEEAHHISTISAATMKQPDSKNLSHLEKQFVAIQHLRKSRNSANKAYFENVTLLKGLVTGTWYKDEANINKKKLVD